MANGPDIEPIPHSVAEGKLELPGLDPPLTVHVLDNGQRVIGAHDVRRFVEWLHGGKMTKEDLVELARRIG